MSIRLLQTRNAVIGGRNCVRVGHEVEAIDPGELGSMRGVYLTKKNGGRLFVPESNVTEVTMADAATPAAAPRRGRPPKAAAEA